MNQKPKSTNTHQSPDSAALFPAMRYDNVPAIDARYWTGITLASIFGCNLGDCLSYYDNWNHWIGLIPLVMSFTALVFAERRTQRSTQAWYWAVVIVLRAAATNLADLATHTFAWSYPRVIAGLTVLQILTVLPVAPRLIQTGKSRAGRPAANGWYWLALLTAGTLGTAMGDCSAEELHLGTGCGTLVLGAIFAVILASGSRWQWTPKLAYWSAIVAIRAAGTTAGDWLAFREDPGLNNGLHLGLALSTALTGLVFVTTLLLWRTGRISIVQWLPDSDRS
jgi:uncharacterized membrane-anchored protein